MTLVEPGRHAARGNFHRPYVLARNGGHRSRPDRLRLMDIMTVILPEADPNYMAAPEAGEFCVVDVVTREKGYFDLSGLTPDQITGMASSHFDSTAFQVGPSIWFV